jgi:hypothetical protein
VVVERYDDCIGLGHAQVSWRFLRGHCWSLRVGRMTIGSWVESSSEIPCFLALGRISMRQPYLSSAVVTTFVVERRTPSPALRVSSGPRCAR